MALNAQDAVSAASSNEDTSEGASILKMGAERDSPASDDTSEGTFVAKTEDERGSPTDGKRGDGTKGSGSNEMFGDKVEGECAIAMNNGAFGATNFSTNFRKHLRVFHEVSER